MASWAWAPGARPRRSAATSPPAACSRRTSFLAGGECPAQGTSPCVPGTLSLRSDLREYSVDLVERGVLDLEPARNGGLGDDPHPGPQAALEAVRKCPDRRGFSRRGGLLPP